MFEHQSDTDFPEDQKPKKISILPLFDTVLFPKMVLPLVIMQNKSIQLIDEAMNKDRIIGLVTSKKTYDPNDEQNADHLNEELFSTGTSALILKMAKDEDGKVQLLVQGLSRFIIKKYIAEKPYLQEMIDNKKVVWILLLFGLMAV